MQKWFFRVIITAIIFCLCVGSVSAAAEMIVNGDFSQDGYGWEESISSGTSGLASITYSSPDVTTDDLAVYFTATTNPDYVYASLSQDVDLTYVNTISYELMDIGIETYSYWGGFVVKVDNTQIWEIDVNNDRCYK